MREEDHRAAFPRSGQSRAEGPGASDRVEDGIRPEPARPLARAARDLLGLEARVRSEFQRHQKPLRPHVGDEHQGSRKESAEEQDVQQSHAPRSDDRGAEARRPGDLEEPRAPNAPQHAGPRLDEDRRLVRKSRRQLPRHSPDRPLSHEDVVAETARDEEVLAKNAAKSLASPNAQGALSARHVVETTTRSPGRNSDAPPPEATTSPITSCPSTVPGETLSFESLKRSVPQSPAQRSRRSSSPGPGGGQSTSSSRALPPPAQTTARVRRGGDKHGFGDIPGKNRSLCR